MHEKQLDTLRTLAVGAVFYSHLVDDRSQAGALGVRLFFVLSGFLITRILLQARSESDGGAGRTMLAFYARRMLRIFPAYFVTVGLMALFFWPEVKASLPWHLLFASNIWLSIHNAWEPWFLVHLWSLSVEEQFYLVWPLLMLFSPRRRLPLVCVAAIALSLAFRLLWPGGEQDLGASLLPPAALDALGAGALLAVCRQQGVAWPRWTPWIMVSVGSALLLMVKLAPQTVSWLGPRAEVAANSLLPLLLFVPLVGATSKGFKGPLGRLLELTPLRALGRISYGLYLYHLPVLAVATALADRNLVPYALTEPGLLRLAFVGATTIAVAAMSWRLMERPINALKRHFDYRTPSADRPPEATQTQAAG